MNGTRGHSAGRERGAALIVAIGVLTLLLVIALTFFRASIGDVRTAQNTVDGVRAELLADGATALAIGFLNHDRFIHPTYTSLDHAWKTYFNGTAFAGKPHLWAPLLDPVPGNGVHRMSPLRSRVTNGNGEAVDRVGIIEIDRRLITPATYGDAMYIPRVDFNTFAGLGLAQGTAPENYSTFVRDGIDNDSDGQIDEPGETTELQNPFIVTADLADPTNPAKFSPIQALLNSPILNGTVTFQADRDALVTTVYDTVEPSGRDISLSVTASDDTDLTLPYEQIHFLTDVDNDGDGLNDSIWLPVGADRYFPEDGLDNDLDGYIDEADLDGEPGVFMYRGDTDGIDNDFDGEVDEGDPSHPDYPYEPGGEYRYVIFTVPAPWRADLDNNGILERVGPNADEVTRMGITSTDIVQFEGDINQATGEPIAIGQGRIGNYIYSRDNDYDLVLDQPSDASHYMLTAPYDVNGNGRPDVLDALEEFVAPGTFTNPPVTAYLNLLVTIIGQEGLQEWQNNGFQGVPIPTWGVDGEDNDGDGLIDEGDEAAFMIQGETVTELTGRMAILITDESSKVNINAAGGWSYPAFPDPLSPPGSGPLLGIDPDPSALLGPDSTPLQRAFADGVGPHEFDTRVIPDIGSARARWMWQYLMGAREGYFSQDARPNDPFLYHDFDFEGDATLPGYGYVDDNANLLQLSLSRINSRGGPNYYVQGPLNPPPDPVDPIDPSFDLGLVGLKWDGIDEPGEYQHFRPLRNLVAETSGADTDGDDVIDEIGELGDQYYRTHQQLKLLNAGFSGSFPQGLNDEGEFNGLRNYVTAHSSDRNERHFHQDSALARYDFAKGRQTTGQRKDLNLTRAGDVARTVKRDWSFPASVAESWGVVGGALAVRNGALTFGEPSADVGPMPAGGYTVDFLRGMRQENTTVLSEARIMNFVPAAGTAFTLLADSELRVHQVAATLKDYADLDYTRSVDDEIFVQDLWWQRLAEQAALNDPLLVDAANIAQAQRIYYTTAGLEAIRINEIMVRPVRRFEAEAITDIDVNAPGNEDIRGLYPNRFVRGNFPTPVTVEQREDEGFRMRVRTTTDAVDAHNARLSDNLTIVDTGDEGDPEGERWNRRPQVDRSGIFALDAGLLGLESAWATYRRYVTVRDPDDNRGQGADYQVPDVVQFSVQATEGLPPGRYYMTVNTQYVDDAGVLRESVFNEENFLFVMKTGTLEQDWFADLMNIDSYVNAGQIYNEAWREPALLGSDALGGSAGMAFLQGDAFFRFDPNVAPGNQYSTTNIEFGQNNILDRNLGFTIEVPELVGAATPEEDQWIHIAFRRGRGPDDETGFVVNFLEFSQEPDHEWIEIVNQSDDVVDLSGWQLVVESHPLGFGPMTVPAGTQIAPRGMLLLGTNKFDYGYNVDPITGNTIIVEGVDDDPLDPDLLDRGLGFFVNGIGLATDSLSVLTLPTSVLSGITVPQVPFPPFGALEGSVFFRSSGVDYLDINGNGLDDTQEDVNLNTIPDATEGLVTTYDIDVRSTIDPESISGPFPQPDNKAWDRIVELEINDLANSPRGRNFQPADVGRIVLGGGIFPNRPEFDGVDNDGDNAIIGFDGIDNDGDGGFPDEAFEGVDEGRYAREQWLANGIPVPGAFNEGTVAYRSLFFDFDVDLPDFWTGGLEPNPPQWKEFMERRNFPGDNVIVTLYEGLAPGEPTSLARVADRITYTQRDVDNRQIDDTILVTDFDLDLNITPPSETPFGDANFGDVGVQFPLDDRFLSFWPENTMGQDFARSLERKHPDYTGDRFGTQNRFQATDGNYDDWSESTGRWERQIARNFDDDLIQAILIDRRNVTEYSHALSGTPLRRNVPARYAENHDFDVPTDYPRRDTTFAGVTFRNRPLVSPGDALTMPHTTKHQLVTGVETVVYPSAPTEPENYLVDMTSPNVRLVSTNLVGIGDLTYDTAMLGQRFDDSPVRDAINFFHDVRAFIGDVGTTDSVSLNVGQATVIQVLRPIASSSSPSDPWNVITGRPPQLWSPLMAFELTGTGGIDDTAAGPPFTHPYNYERQYLFQRLDTFPLTVDNTRWPMPVRTLVYASRNFDNFSSVDPLDGAQAVFVWDGDDGLENGEYDVYIVTTEDLSLLARADNALLNVSNPADRRRLLTDQDDLVNGAVPGVGAPFVAAAAATANSEVFLDIEVFRDSNGDRTAWTDVNGDGFILDSELHRGLGVPAESFGVVRGAQPDADGVIRYGNVRVDNNFLAISIRNRTPRQLSSVTPEDDAVPVARVSRVILAARGKTPGRININTVETKRISLGDPSDPNDPIDSDPRRFYNPLVGIPGMLELPAPPNRDSDAIGPANMFVDTAGFDFTDENNATPIPQVFATGLAQRIVDQRLRLLREQPDGRYYELASDLLADAHFARVAEHPSLIETGPALRPPLIMEFENYLPDDGNGIVDTDAVRAGALREAAFRFGKMQNLITVKGEVFEILVTVQSGYGTDANGDGRINWRDDSEFTAMAEKTARTIYER